MIKKGITLVVVLLFIGMSIASSCGYNLEERVSNPFSSELVDNAKGSSSHTLKAYLIANNNIYLWEVDRNCHFTFICDIGGLPELIIQGTYSGNGIIIGFDSNRDLYVINITTGSHTFIGNTGLEELMDITYDPVYKTIWGISTKNFYEINMTTGVASFIGSLQISELMIRLTSDKNGDVYALDLGFSSSHLYTINITTGKATILGNTGMGANILGDYELFYDCNNDIMYTWISGFNYGTYTPFIKLYGPTIPREHTSYYGGIIAVPFGWTNQPPDTPAIEGKRTFKEGEDGVHPYTINTTDPEDDDIYYLINWSNGNITWYGPYESGKEITINISIPVEEGSYTLCKVKAKDIFGAESDWAILEITVPKSKYVLFQGFLERFPPLQKILNVLRVNSR